MYSRNIHINVNTPSAVGKVIETNGTNHRTQSRIRIDGSITIVHVASSAISIAVLLLHRSDISAITRALPLLNAICESCVFTETHSPCTMGNQPLDPVLIQILKSKDRATNNAGN